MTCFYGYVYIYGRVLCGHVNSGHRGQFSGGYICCGQESREYVINKFVVDVFLWTSSYNYNCVTMTVCEHFIVHEALV